MGVLKPELIIKSIVPVVMAGILGIYGLIVAVILFQKGRASEAQRRSEREVWLHLPGRLQALIVRTVLRAQLSSRRARHRYCGRRGRARQRAAARRVRGNDPDSHFRGSAGAVRAHRRDHPEPGLIDVLDS